MHGGFLFCFALIVSETGSPIVVLLVLELATWTRLVWNTSQTHLPLSRVLATTPILQRVVEVDLILFNEV